VALEVDGHISTDRLYCLLGGVPWQSPCASRSVVDIRWTLWSDSREVASGDSRNAGGSNSGSTVTRTFGKFMGTPGTPYVLEIASMVDGSVLAAANPRIVVKLDPLVTKGYVVFASLAAIVISSGLAIWLTVLALGALSSLKVPFARRLLHWFAR
jgi:hypothetical protein